MRNGDLLAAADIDVLLVGIVFEDEYAGIREVVDEEKLAQRLACTPYRDRGRALLLRLMKPPDQRGNDVTVLGVVVVSGTIKVGRHHGDEIGAILTAICLAQLDPRNLGNGIPLIGRLERSGEQLLLAHGLAGQLRIDARGAEEQELAHPGLITAVDGISRDRQIVRNELGRIATIGMDAADPGRGYNHHVRPARGQESFHLGLAFEVDGGAVGGDYFAGHAGQTPHNGGADHPGMTGDVNPLASEVEYLVRHSAGPYAPHTLRCYLFGGHSTPCFSSSKFLSARSRI